MQLWSRRKEESPEAFWQETAEKRGGPIGLTSFATFLGRSHDELVELPGLLYTVGSMVWFEDFEHDNWLARVVRPRGSFTKTEFSFAVADVQGARLVTRRGAMGAIAGGVASDSLRPVSFFDRVVANPVMLFAMKDGSSLFFDLLLKKEFLGLFEAGK